MCISAHIQKLGDKVKKQLQWISTFSHEHSRRDPAVQALVMEYVTPAAVMALTNPVSLVSGNKMDYYQITSACNYVRICPSTTCSVQNRLLVGVNVMSTIQGSFRDIVISPQASGISRLIKPELGYSNSRDIFLILSFLVLITVCKHISFRPS